MVMIIFPDGVLGLWRDGDVRPQHAGPGRPRLGQGLDTDRGQGYGEQEAVVFRDHGDTGHNTEAGSVFVFMLSHRWGRAPGGHFSLGWLNNTN